MHRKGHTAESEAYYNDNDSAARRRLPGCDPGDHESTELKAHNKHIQTSQATQKQTPSNQSLVARKAPAS